VKHEKIGFTIVELLTSLAIIAMLVSLLLPALSMVRNIAKETKQKAQFATIEMALIAFKGDYGDYPPSDFGDPPRVDYCGAQKLAEALLGWDLLGFHPDSAWMSDGRDGSGSQVYRLNLDPTNPDDLKNINERRGPYLELATANAFKLQDLFATTSPLEGNAFVICDSFGAKPISVGGETVKAGTPVLYYRANTSSKRIISGLSRERIYNYLENDLLIKLGKVTDTTKSHPLENQAFFYSEEFILDPKITTTQRPYRPDSYILISAGVDGLYGTSDDITNFGN